MVCVCVYVCACGYEWDGKDLLLKPTSLAGDVPDVEVLDEEGEEEEVADS